MIIEAGSKQSLIFVLLSATKNYITNACEYGHNSLQATVRKKLRSEPKHQRSVASKATFLFSALVPKTLKTVADTGRRLYNKFIIQLPASGLLPGPQHLLYPHLA